MGDLDTRIGGPAGAFPSTRQSVLAALATAQVDRRVALEVTDVHSLLDLVTFGLGVALVPQSFSVKTDRARFVELAGVVPVWETVTVTSEPTSAAASALLHEVRGRCVPGS